MQLTVLGCAGTYPAPDSPCSSYLLEAQGYRLLLDLGSGAVGALARHHPGGDLRDIDAALISHLHGDHWLDLVPYAYARRYAPGGAAPTLPVYSPSGLARLLRYVGASTVRAAYDIRRLSTAELTLGPFTINPARTAHPVETYALRVAAGGRTLTYSADTGASDAIVALAHGSDTFLCEATSKDGENHPPGLHLTGAQAGAHAARADVNRLLLTHIAPYGDPQHRLASARAVYSGPVELARSGASYTI